ncbi:TPA: DnaB-like helicase N-terminal domain-containing protein [Pseudomonas aeruginosa]|uniref:DnaB-like helicase N-terminal domain-containing protein n=1 Tax=Stutzerimonas stutzeri TaxID=316 RepID=UPI001648921A|nr:DnaB-like helicase N-terminal domain-containing protein [Stutzerimonas stutzeri]CAD2260656.1 Replicative DNA helicase [Stutzerimonas stutzeri]
MSLPLDANPAAQTSPGLIRLDPAYALAAHLAERHLLGYLMLNGEAWHVTAKTIDPGDFDGYPHCRIYLAMETLASLGEAIDILTLCELLESDEHYQAAGSIQLLGQLATETPIRFEQVSGLARLLRGFGVLRSSLNESYQGQRRLCSLLEAKFFGLSHGKSWVATIEDTIRQEQPFPQAWLGQRVCYVYDECIGGDATL